MRAEFDVAVIGLGGIGAHALERLSHEQVRCIGFDRFQPPHDLGSSHGLSRLIRLAYFEHPNYVPLLRRSFELWDQLAQHTTKPLLIRNGLLQVGVPESELITGLRSAAAQHQLQLDPVAPPHFGNRFRWPTDHIGLLEPIAGILVPETAIETALQVARQRGATIHNHERVCELSLAGNRIRITTDQDQYEVQRVIIATGAWSSDWFSWQVATPRVLRKHQFWFPVHDSAWNRSQQSVSFYFETPFGSFYGIPGEPQEGLKIARHDGGVSVSPDDPDRQLGRDEELESIVRFAQSHLSGIGLEPIAHEICRYAMSEDGHFRLTTSRHSPHIIGVSCLSGHGFKFGPVLGEILAGRILTGQWDPRVRFLTNESDFS